MYYGFKNMRWDHFLWIKLKLQVQFHRLWICADDPIKTCNKKLHFLISWINSTKKSLKIDEYWWNNNETTIKILFTHHPCAIALGTCFGWGPWFCFPAVTFRTFVNYVHLHRFVYPSSCFLKSQIQVKLKPWRINNLAKF